MTVHKVCVMHNVVLAVWIQLSTNISFFKKQSLTEIKHLANHKKVQFDFIYSLLY